MILSIVTGTYNRLSHLKMMVATARRSVGVGIPYELVIADGGSVDGTQVWCKQQPDIHLIEHGKLIGCIPAFNDAASKAVGDYVILGNDDIEFVDESIQAAIVYMQDNPYVGMGCFYQDRHNKPWHVDHMQAIHNGKLVSVPYGQVCIVPRWLGDKFGWWGDYLIYYGGDNDLSCKVWEYGYRVEPIPCAHIHDIALDDDLRKINTDGLKVHPDSQKWVERWTRKGVLGAVIKDVPVENNPIQRHLRILYAPIYEPGYPIQKVQRHGLRDALSKHGLVTEVDYMLQTFGGVYDTACHFQPDIIITQLQDSKNATESDILELRQEHPKATLINWNGDYHPENLTDPNYVNMLRHFHYAGFVTTEFVDMWVQKHVNAFYWQIGYENANDNLSVASHDVLFLANGYSKDRISLGKLLRNLRYNVGIYGSWAHGIKANGNNLYNFDGGASLYKRCKIAIGDSQWPHATGFVSNRLFQAMSAGAFLLQQKFDGLQELLGLQNGVHLVVWNDAVDLVDKISYYLSHKDERIKIAKIGQEYVMEFHSFDARVSELFTRLGI